MSGPWFVFSLFAGILAFCFVWAIIVLAFL